MKKSMQLIFVVLALCIGLLPMGALAADTWDGSSIASEFAGGSGTEDAPYQIATGAQLAYLASQVNSGATNYSGVYFQLTDDIDLNNKEWTPIGGAGTGKTFAGKFNGNGKTISNLKITKSLSYTNENISVGLFGAATSAARIMNFILNNVDVQGSGNVAAVLGGSGGAEAMVNFVQVTGNVKVHGYWYVGGIVGKGYATVMNCLVEGDGANTSSISITGGYAGGIVGYMGETMGESITGCTVKNLTVSGAHNGVGGVSGILHYGNTISDCEVDNVVVWQTTDPDSADENRIYCGAFAGTYLDNNGNNSPTLSGNTFVGELYSGTAKNDVLESTRYVGSLWYGAEPPATVNVTNCTITAAEHKHKMSAVDLKKASNMEDGNIAYWQCSGCGLYFSDAQGQTEISLEQTVIHKYSAWSRARIVYKGIKLSGIDLNTGLGTGSVEGVWTWKNPDEVVALGTYKYAATFTPNDTNLYAASDVEVTVTYAVLQEIPAKKASNTEDGNIAYWYSVEEDVYFSDPETLTEIEDLATVKIPKYNVSYKTKSTYFSAIKLADAWLDKAQTNVEGGGTLAWKDPDTVITLGANQYDAIFTPNNTDKYEPCTIQITVEYVELEEIPAKKATNMADGNIAYWYYAEKNIYFSDKENMTMIALADTVIPKYSVTCQMKPVVYDPIKLSELDPNSLPWNITAEGKGTLSWKMPDEEVAEGTHEYAATFTPSDTEKYAPGDVSVTITYAQLQEIPAKKASTTEDGNIVYWYSAVENVYYSDPETLTEIEDLETVKIPKYSVILPASVAATGAGTLETVSLSGCASSIDGVWTWDKPATKVEAGTHTYAVTFTPKDAAKYEIYHGTLAVGLSRTLTAVNAKKASTTADGNIAYWYSAMEDAYYLDAEAKVQATAEAVKIPAYSVTLPVGLSTTSGNALEKISLSSCKSSIDGVFAWKAPATKVELGAKSYAVTFTPDDATKYEAYTGSAQVTGQAAQTTEGEADTSGAVKVESETTELKPEISNTTAETLAAEANSMAATLIAQSSEGSKGDNTVGGNTMGSSAEVAKLTNLAKEAEEDDTLHAEINIEVKDVQPEEAVGSVANDVKKIENATDKASEEVAAVFEIDVNLVVTLEKSNATETPQTASAPITELAEAATITLTLPGVDARGMAVRILYVHNGETKSITIEPENKRTFVNEDGTYSTEVTFDANEFSTYAVVVSSKCKVNFETNGGSKMPTVDPIDFTASVPMPVDPPTKDGHLFEGWYADAALTKEYDFTKAVGQVAEVTIYAKWTKFDAADIPQTGDGSNMGLWLALLGMSGCALLLVNSKRRATK